MRCVRGVHVRVQCVRGACGVCACVVCAWCVRYVYVRVRCVWGVHVHVQCVRVCAGSDRSGLRRPLAGRAPHSLPLVHLESSAV